MTSVAQVVGTKLAIAGGLPVRTARFAAWPAFSQEEIEAAVSVLRSGKVNYWTGEEGRLFEQEFAERAGCSYAVALANGTVALELALYALGIGPGDEVVVPSRTFVASASCVAMRGATPVFADVDRVSQNITAETIRTVLSPRTKAIVLVHLAGWPCDMDPILALARQYNLKVVEDCAQAQGAIYKNAPVGSMGDAAAFSFCQDKIMTTCGEGGVLATNHRTVWELAWSFKDHGKHDGAMAGLPSSPVFRWVHERVGTNWRMTEMQAAIGRTLLPNVPGMIEKRRRLAALLTERFSQVLALRVTAPPAEIYHAFYKYYVFLRPDRLREGWDQTAILKAINAEGIPCFAGSCSEVYLEKAFEKFRPNARLSTARELGENSLMFLVHPTLCEQDIDDTCVAVEKVLKFASTC